MSVIEHEFDRAGRRLRLAARRFARLLMLDALHETNIADNPVPYLERAAERIDQLEKTIFEALQAATPAAPAGETVAVDRAELEALRACRDLLRQAAAEFSEETD